MKNTRSSLWYLKGSIKDTNDSSILRETIKTLNVQLEKAQKENASIK